jgi:glycosyltransferase involved in cell wall biosynthesis
MTAQKILICMHDFSRGGTERIAIGLAKSWAAAGRDVTILCGAADGGLCGLVDPRVAVIVLDPPVRRGFLSRLRLGHAMGKRLAALRPDVIFLPGNFHFFLAFGLRRADPHPAIVLKISNPPLPWGIAPLFSTPFFQYLTRAIDGFAAMSAGFARELEALVPGKSFAVLHDPMYVRTPDARELPQLGGGGVRQILLAGRLEPQKDVPLALRTIAALNRIRPAHLTILGDGSLRGRTMRGIKTLKLESMVTLAGHVPSVDAYFARADALLITSHFEGGPAVATEALAHGLPLVSTDCSHMLHDIMTIPEAGRIVASRQAEDLAAALDQVCAAPRPAQARLAGLVESFEPERCARAYLDWFDRVAADRHDA